MYQIHKSVVAHGIVIGWKPLGNRIKYRGDENEHWSILTIKSLDIEKSEFQNIARTEIGTTVVPKQKLDPSHSGNDIGDTIISRWDPLALLERVSQEYILAKPITNKRSGRCQFEVAWYDGRGRG